MQVSAKVRTTWFAHLICKRNANYMYLTGKGITQFSCLNGPNTKKLSNRKRVSVVAVVNRECPNTKTILVAAIICVCLDPHS